MVKQKTRVLGFGNELHTAMGKNNILHIDVRDYPNCTWVLDGDRFVCTHDKEEIIKFVEDHMGIDGPYQTEHAGYVCEECGQPLDGNPEDDQDYIAEMQLMELLGK